MELISTVWNHICRFQVMLGSGDLATEQWMRSTEAAYKDKFRGWVGFNVPISHRITAGWENSFTTVIIRNFL